MNIIDILTWVGGALLVWAVFAAFVVARMKHRSQKSWHGRILSAVGEFWNAYRFYNLDSTCSYWSALAFLPLTLLCSLVILVAAVAFIIVGFLFATYGRVMVRLWWFLLNGEFTYFTVGVKHMFVKPFEVAEENWGSDSFRPTRSLAVFAFLVWVLYRLASVDYDGIANGVTSTVTQVDWSGNLMMAGMCLGVIVGLVLVCGGIKMAWPTITKAWDILHGKVCYRLPYREDA